MLALTTNKKLPKGILGAFGGACWLNKIRDNAPKNPSRTPTTRYRAICSLSSMAENKNTIMGVVVIITVLLMGVEYSSPLKKASILMPIPKNAARTKCLISAREIGCLGKNRLTVQKRTVPPISRIIIKPNPCT